MFRESKEQLLKDEAVRKRAKEVCRSGSFIAVAGLALLICYRLTGHGLPCIFRALTGYLCPGCGMTRAVVAILDGNFAKAWQYNALSLTLLPVLALYLLYKAARFIIKGEEEFQLGEVIFLTVLLAIALAFAVIRNL